MASRRFCERIILESRTMILPPDIIDYYSNFAKSRKTLTKKFCFELTEYEMLGEINDKLTMIYHLFDFCI